MPCWFYRRIREFRDLYGPEPGFPASDPVLIPWSAYKPPEANGNGQPRKKPKLSIDQLAELKKKGG